MAISLIIGFSIVGISFIPNGVTSEDNFLSWIILFILSLPSLILFIFELFPSLIISSMFEKVGILW